MAQPLSSRDFEAELAARGGLLPVMHLFPSDSRHPGNSIPWQKQDMLLQEWLAGSAAYTAAVEELKHAHDC
jgi:hypothetical protein